MGQRLEPEKVAYWYLRLNGFLQLENFVVHPPGRGGQRTDADLLGVRFPYRAERLYDDPEDVMPDDLKVLGLSPNDADFVISEVTTKQPCKLNGPWTDADAQNIQRVLSAIGLFPHHEIEAAAASLYECGLYTSESSLRIRLVAFGGSVNPDLAQRFPEVTQITWPEVLQFIWNRLTTYRTQKAQTDQWDRVGKQLKQLAKRCADESEFIDRVALRFF